MKCAFPVLVSYTLPSVIDYKYKSNLFESKHIHEESTSSIIRRYVPCGRCLYCKKRRANEWSFRIEQEAEITKTVYKQKPLFITLTYDPKNLPKGNNLHHTDVRHFFARLRHFFTFRYFLIGEYGYNGTERAHYHFILFPTSLSACISRSLIHSVWRKGRVSVDPVTPGRIGYVSSYCASSYTPPGRVKSYSTKSLRPAIGYSFFCSLEFLHSVKNGDFSIRRSFIKDGNRVEYRIPIPRYFIRKLNEHETRTYQDYEPYKLSSEASYRNSVPHREMPTPKPISGPDEFTNYYTIQSDRGEYSVTEQYYHDLWNCFWNEYNRHLRRNPLQHFTIKHFKKWVTSFLPYRSRNRLRAHSVLATNLFVRLNWDVFSSQLASSVSPQTCIAYARRLSQGSHLCLRPLTAICQYQPCTFSALTV